MDFAFMSDLHHAQTPRAISWSRGFARDENPKKAERQRDHCVEQTSDANEDIEHVFGKSEFHGVDLCVVAVGDDKNWALRATRTAACIENVTAM